MVFENRREAGKQLAAALNHLKGQDVAVLGLPRGGVVTAAEVARELKAPLGVVFVRKIGHPDSPEYAIGAIAEDDDPIYDHVADNVSPAWLRLEEEAAREVMDRRHELYDDTLYGVHRIERRITVLVDDGIATGFTMQAAIHNVRRRGAKYVIVAAPVASRQSVDRLSQLADEVVSLDNPENFLGSVGAHYLHFDQIDDMEVRQLLVEQAHAYPDIL